MEQQDNKRYERINLPAKEGVHFKLVVPTKINKDKYPKYYIEYTFNSKQYQFKRDIKPVYLRFLLLAKNNKWTSKRDRQEKLARLYDTTTSGIISTLNITPSSENSNVKLTQYSNVLEAINAFYKYQKNQYLIGQLAGISNYTDRNKKLNVFFEKEYHEMLIKELTAFVWDNFRTQLRVDGKINSTINQYLTYVKSWYNWIINYHEIPIIDHTNKLKKLDTSQQIKKYQELSNEVVAKYVEAVCSNDKWLRLELIIRLVGENTIRPIQVRQIQAKHINRETRAIVVYDKKSKRWRTIIVSEKVMILINKIFENTEMRNFVVDADDYLVGGFNAFKKGKPYSQNMIKDVLIEPFRKEFPDLKDVNIYDFKHTSITKASKRGNLLEVQKRAGHGKITTTQIYDRSEAISAAIPIEDLMLIK